MTRQELAAVVTEARAAGEAGHAWLSDPELLEKLAKARRIQRAWAAEAA